MGRIKVMGLCLVAIFVVGALSSTSALATTAPYFKVKANPVAEGKPLAEGEKVKLTLKLSSETAKLYVPALSTKGAAITCTGGKSEGEAFNEYIAKVRQEGRLTKGQLTLTGCGVTISPSCLINEEKSGSASITFNHVTTRLGYKPGTETVQTLTQAESTVNIAGCELAGKYSISGNLVGSVSPINTFTKTFTASAKVTSKFAQELTEIEFPQTKETLKGQELRFGESSAGLEHGFELKTTSEAELEIATK
jgi:hypothetical protein